MRVLVLTSSYPRYPGDGTAPFVRSISESLAQLGHCVTVLAPYDREVVVSGPGDRSLSEVPVSRFRYAPLRAWHIMGHARSLSGDMSLKPAVFVLLPAFFLVYVAAALAAIRRKRPDVIYAHWVVPSGFIGACLSYLTGIPLVISLHGSDVYLSQKLNLLRQSARWALRRAVAVTACSEDLRSGALRLGANPDTVKLLAWGADPSRFSPDVVPVDRATYGMRNSDLLVLSLGRMVPKKGFGVLIEAIALLAESEPAISLVIGGEGAQREYLADLSVKLGVSDRVSLPGRVAWDQVPAFLNMGDVFVLPSVLDSAGNMDGLPTVLLEAMALGKPVVATDIAGVPLVVEDGVSGILCRPGDKHDLAAALGRIVESRELRDSLGRSARAAVVTQFNWLEVAKKLTGLFPMPRCTSCEE